MKDNVNAEHIKQVQSLIFNHFQCIPMKFQIPRSKQYTNGALASITQQFTSARNRLAFI